MKVKSSRVIRSNLLLLSRFHTLDRHNSRDSNKEKLCHYLEKLPDKMASHSELKSQLVGSIYILDAISSATLFNHVTMLLLLLIRV